MEMLDRLFVENFALRGGSHGGGRGERGGRHSQGGGSRTGAASSRPPLPLGDPASVDLSRFVVPDGCSDDDDTPTRASLPVPAPHSRDVQPPAAATPAHVGLSSGPSQPEAPTSPRSRLLQGLNFHALPVAE